MSVEQHAPQQQRVAARGLYKEHVAKRYGWQSSLSVDRAWQQYGTLPPPDFFMGRRPFWYQSTLDAFDAERKKKAAAKIARQQQAGKKQLRKRRRRARERAAARRLVDA